MSYDLSHRLVLGVASSALFDLTESGTVFTEKGEEAYREFQEQNRDVAFDPGVAYPFVKRLRGLNTLRPADPPVEVIVLSKNSPETGLRVMRSISKHGLPMSRAIFTSGKSPYMYMRALSMSLFLSAEDSDVRGAIREGFPAGTVLSSVSSDGDGDGDEVRVAFDFDGVLSDDSAEQYYAQAADLLEYAKHEEELREEPISPGPLKQFLADINHIQQLEKLKVAEDPDYVTRLGVSLITARNAPAHERAVNSLRSWGVSVDNAFFLGGVDKGLIVQELKPHIYFDDQQGHLGATAKYVPSVHVPFGKLNQDEPA